MRSDTAGDSHVRICNAAVLVKCTVHSADVKARGTYTDYSALKDESTLVTKFTTRISIQKPQTLPQCLFTYNLCYGFRWLLRVSNN